MRAELAAAAVVIVAAVAGVRYWENSEPALGEPQASAMTAAPAPETLSMSAGARDQVRIIAAPDHQFYVTAAVNNSPASFLVDTGASYVALRESDARLAGVYITWTDYDRPIRTANGETKAAMVTIDVIEIDRIRIQDVKAFVLPDDQLSVNLLGMSFLSRLHSVEARAGELVLKG
ncbi:MAG: TIGR02281 family clan AA aspartic protease [Parvularculaceae bacterium]